MDDLIAASDRVIPACAGNTDPDGGRVRPAPGSSPRARGTPFMDDLIDASDRVIPACAGNTDPDGGRVRPAPGSSPRARGTPFMDDLIDASDRVIPACAGNTAAATTPAPAKPGHPRVRGEHDGLAVLCNGLSGSSPRARGTLTPARLREGSGRVIPACAGNTMASPYSATASAGHPRVRGEH